MILTCYCNKLSMQETKGILHKANDSLFCIPTTVRRFSSTRSKSSLGGTSPPNDNEGHRGVPSCPGGRVSCSGPRCEVVAKANRGAPRTSWKETKAQSTVTDRSYLKASCSVWHLRGQGTWKIQGHHCAHIPGRRNSLKRRKL